MQNAALGQVPRMRATRASANLRQASTASQDEATSSRRCFVCAASTSCSRFPQARRQPERAQARRHDAVRDPAANVCGMQNALRRRQCRRRRTSAHALTSAALFADVTSNTIFMAGFWGWAAAQVAKVFTYKVKKGKWDLLQLIASGGMPSSHSSLCMSVTSAIGVVHGFSSTLFAMGLCFSLIVMYDAAGVRRHAGTQAEVLNLVVQELLHKHAISQRKLKEVLGHTPLQVCMGAMLGVFCGFFYATTFSSPYLVTA